MQNLPAVYWPPALPYYLSVWHIIFGSSELISRVAMLPLFLVFSFFLYRLSNIYFNRRAGNISLLIYALYPTAILHSLEPLTQLPMALGLLAMLYFSTVSASKFKQIAMMALGLTLGINILIRASSALLIPIAIRAIYIKQKSLWNLFIPLIIPALIVSLWLLKAYNFTGLWTYLRYGRHQTSIG